jgi:hypothetical protein
MVCEPYIGGAGRACLGRIEQEGPEGLSEGSAREARFCFGRCPKGTQTSYGEGITGLCWASVLEIKANSVGGNTSRAVYTVKLGEDLCPSLLQEEEHTGH